MPSHLTEFEWATLVEVTVGGARPQAFSHIIGKAFREFTTRHLTVHRLRARFASLLVKTLREEEVARVGSAGLREETILERAAAILGHANTNTLRFYLNIDLDTNDLAATMAIRSALALPVLGDKQVDTDKWLSTPDTIHV